MSVVARERGVVKNFGSTWFVLIRFSPEYKKLVPWTREKDRPASFYRNHFRHTQSHTFYATRATFGGDTFDPTYRATDRVNLYRATSYKVLIDTVPRYYTLHTRHLRSSVKCPARLPIYRSFRADEYDTFHCHHQQKITFRWNGRHEWELSPEQFNLGEIGCRGVIKKRRKAL